MTPEDIGYMQTALEEAELAAGRGEVPVGAVAVKNGRIIGRAGNRVEEKLDATSHAEIELLRQCSAALGDWRMEEVTFYVTKEPCAMCAGAMVNARLKRVVFGLPDPRSGACGSTGLDVAAFPGMLWRVETEGGVLADEAHELIRRFFREVRER
ncbi:MAG: nucleoside deaminase [Victivallaceae bacterium]